MGNASVASGRLYEMCERGCTESISSPGTQVSISRIWHVRHDLDDSDERSKFLRKICGSFKGMSDVNPVDGTRVSAATVRPGKSAPIIPNLTPGIPGLSVPGLRPSQSQSLDRGEGGQNTYQQSEWEPRRTWSSVYLRWQAIRRLGEAGGSSLCRVRAYIDVSLALTDLNMSAL